jgi:predicted transglutaminase-like cysteine proteinase
MNAFWRPLLLFFVCALMTAGQRQAIAGPAQNSFLGTVEFEVADLEILEQWQDVLARIEAERPAYRECERRFADCAPAALLAWRALIGRLRGKPLRQQLEEINKFANTRTLRSDLEVFGKNDHWATPLEFLEHSGDGEDFAILKYVSLRELGVPKEQVRLLQVDDTLINESEIMLVVYEGDMPLFLGTHWGFVAEQQYIHYHIPYLSMNEDRRWTHYRVLEDGKEE